MADKGPVITPAEMKDVFSRLLTPGDTVLIHSSLAALGWFEKGPESMIQALLVVLGERGNLVMPTATTSFSKTGFFDVLNTPSETGLLTEVFRKMEGVTRSPATMASFAALGPEKEAFTRPYDSYLEPDSPFSALLRLNGQVMLMGVDYRRCTLYHLAEERNAADYNFYKSFSGNIVGTDGRLVEGGQRYYVRRDLSTTKDANPVGLRFEERGKVKIEKLGKGLIRLFNAREFDEFCNNAIQADPRVFLASPTENKTS